MVTRWINPPNTPAPQAPAPRPLASQPLTSQPVRPQAVTPQQPNATPRPAVGYVPGGAGRVAARAPAAKDAPAGKDARVSGQPQAAGASAVRVTRLPPRSDSDGSHSHDHAPDSTRALLFEFTKPIDGLPPPRSAETVAILQGLIDLLPTLDDGSLAELANDALREEIARHRALMVRGHEGVAG